MGHIVDEIKMGLRQLRSWSVAHVNRTANLAAHTISREVIFLCHR
jgi:hypothetical protein